MNVGEMLSSQLAKQWLEHRKCFLKLLTSFQDKVLHFVEMAMSQIFNLSFEDASNPVDWVKQKTDKYTSPKMK